jgi:hypothetical protein
MTFLKVKPMVAHNVKWAGLIFCYQWMAWVLIGGAGMLWPDINNALHDHTPLWLLAIVFWSLVFFVPLIGYFRLIFRLNFCRNISVGLRIGICFCVAWFMTGLVMILVVKSLVATGWFPCFEFHSLRGSPTGEYPS